MRQVQRSLHVKYTSSVGTHTSRENLNLPSVVMHGTKIFLENKQSWYKDEIPLLWGTAGEEIKIGCCMISESTHEKASQISMYNTASNPIATDRKLCASERLDCWYNFTLVQSVFVVCLWAHRDVRL